MPVPLAVVGIGALWAALSAILMKIVELFFTKMVKRVAILVIIVAAVYVAITTLLSLLSSVLVPLIDAVPYVGETLGMALPSNTQACIAAVIAVELACLTYSLTIKALNYQTKAV